jgi:phage terminase large subunit
MYLFGELMTLNNQTGLYLPSVVGKGYRDFWHYRGRYRVVKGSRASKKSKTAALNFIWLLDEYPLANLLVVRKTERTLKTSCFTELKWAIRRLGRQGAWRITVSPLEMTHRKTGQKIYFRGLDDPLKITSITVDKGVLCWLWVEEAYEISDEAAFNTLDESIRGKVPERYFKQTTLTFNPWNEHHWLKARFFDRKDPDIMAMTTTYRCNEWLDEADERLFERMRTQNPRRYKVAGEGDWGVAEGLVYENWTERAFDLDDIRKRSGVKSVFGLDFGYTNDPSALFCGLYDKGRKRLYVFDEMYRHGMSNEDIHRTIAGMGYGKEQIIADSSEPKSIDRLRMLGLRRVQASRKGPDSVNNGIDFIQDLEILIHPRCVNFLLEIGNYTWAKSREGKTLNKPADDFNHLMDAMRYALEPVIGNRKARVLTRKGFPG